MNKMMAKNIVKLFLLNLKKSLWILSDGQIGANLLDLRIKMTLKTTMSDVISWECDWRERERGAWNVCRDPPLMSKDYLVLCKTM